jgi:hypothetical protein
MNSLCTYLLTFTMYTYIHLFHTYPQRISLVVLDQGDNIALDITEELYLQLSTNPLIENFFI